MAEIFNEQRVIGVHIVPDGTVLHNGQRVVGIREADGGVLFTGGRRVLGVSVLSGNEVIYNEQVVIGAVIIRDGRTLYRFAGWKLDPVARELSDPDGVLINLSDGEFRLLMTLVERPRRVLTRDQLLDLSRGLNAEHFDRAIDVQVSRLRRKLARDGDEDLIRTVRNEGYLFSVDVDRR